ncbi:hypothetical protein ACP4OV_005206 [Aristida adscensionis]
MGSAAAAVEISSDEDDGEKVTGAGKRRRPEDALVWASEFSADSYDSIEALDDSAAIQQLLASLVDTTKVVADEKGTVVDEKSGALNGDDDDCIILDDDPDKAVAVASKEGSRRDASEDELQIVAEKGELACRDFPHSRHLCASLPFSTSSHASHCTMCHCYVCDSPAPCAFWGKGTKRTDHCHATDKDMKWKKLRQQAKQKSKPKPKHGGIQNSFHSSPTIPSLQPGLNAVMPNIGGRLAVSSFLSHNQQVYPSTMVPQNMGNGIYPPKVPSQMPKSTSSQNSYKRTRDGHPVYAPSNASHLHPSIVPGYVPVQPPLPRPFQTARLPEGNSNVIAGSFRSYPPLRPPSAPIVSQGLQFQPTTYPQVAPTSVVRTGLQLPQCTALATKGTQHLQGSSADTTGWKTAIANLAFELGVPDYNKDPPLIQQSASIQPLHPSKLVSQVKVSQVIKAPLQMRPSGGNNLSIHPSGGDILASGSFQTRQPLSQLTAESTLTPCETIRTTFVAPPPMKHDGN